MEFAKITSRGQTTIPKPIRDAAALHEGDMIAFELAGDHVVIRKVYPERDDYLRGLKDTMDEWTSPEDEAAWHDL